MKTIRHIYVAILILTCSLLVISFTISCQDEPQPEGQEQKPILKTYENMPIGYTVPLDRVSRSKMENAKSVGIDCIEVGVNVASFFDNDRNFVKSDIAAKDLMNTAKRTADHAGIEIWSIHMPYSRELDLSTMDEGDRQKVVEAHTKLLDYLKILEPKVILFHPSWHIEPAGQRDLRKDQLVKSVEELDQAVRAIGATMVVENMLGPELMNGQRERALMRTVEETVELFERFPNTVYSAIDMNHIKNPERLIRAMGKRLKTVHIADGTGEAENHWLPCSGQGNNDWVAILTALHEVGYTGPFMYECNYDNEKQLVDCFKTLVSAL